MWNDWIGFGPSWRIGIPDCHQLLLTFPARSIPNNFIKPPRIKLMKLSTTTHTLQLLIVSLTCSLLLSQRKIASRLDQFVCPAHLSWRLFGEQTAVRNQGFGQQP